MNINIGTTIFLVIIAVFLTHLFDTNVTAHNFIVSTGHKVGISAGNFISGTSTCPKGMSCYDHDKFSLPSPCPVGYGLYEERCLPINPN
jgi:hypothetical protein